jgi:hypothetical protein
MFILYGLASVSFLLSYAFFRLAKRNIGNILIALGMFLNPLGYDIIVYGITQVTHSYWMTMSFMYMLSMVFFGLFIYLNQLNPIKHVKNKLKLKVIKMRKTFDELYNEFLLKTLDIFKNDTESLNAQETDMINMLTDAEELEKYINNLGKPNQIEFYNEGNVFFEKRTWNTEHGDIVKLIVSDEPFIDLSYQESKSLEEKLADAVEEENYEKAAKIRDEIKKREKK